MATIRIWDEVSTFLDRFRHDQIIREIVAESGLTQRDVIRLLEIYLNEVHVGYSIVAPNLSPTMRILEVGSGLGLLSAFLVHNGYTVVSLEPEAKGFSFIAAARRILLRYASPSPSEVLDVSVESLDPTVHGEFDLIFSVHVLEHLPQFDIAMTAMTSVLRSTGKMVHLCPNYFFPYDPHFGIPLVPGLPKLTSLVIKSEIRASDLWRSLNFITYWDVVRSARANGLTVRFDKGLLGEMIERLGRDLIFAERHPPVVRLIVRAILWSRLTRLVAGLPSCLASPMLFNCGRNHAADVSASENRRLQRHEGLPSRARKRYRLA